MSIFIFTLPCGTSERFYEDPKDLHKAFSEVLQRSDKIKIYINPYRCSSLCYLKNDLRRSKPFGGTTKKCKDKNLR